MAAITIALLLIAPTAQAIAFCAYFTGLGDTLTLIDPRPWPTVTSTYRALTMTYALVATIVGSVLNLIPAQRRWHTIASAAALITLIAALVLPAFIGHVEAKYGTSFATAKIPHQRSNTATPKRGLIMSYRNGDDPRLVVMPVDLQTHLVEIHDLWFVDRDKADIQILVTGRLAAGKK